MLKDSALRSCQARLVVATTFSVALIIGNRQCDEAFGLGGHNCAIGRLSSRSKPVKLSASGRVVRAEPRKPRVSRLRYTACREKRLTLMNHDIASAATKQPKHAIAVTSRRRSGRRKYR